MADVNAVAELQAKLGTVLSIVTDASYLSIVSNDGELLMHLLREEKLGTDLTSTVAAVKTSAKYFSSILQLSDNNRVLVSGDRYAFVLYCLEEGHSLVFFCEKSSISNAMILGNPSVEESITTIVQDINHIIRTETAKNTEDG